MCQCACLKCVCACMIQLENNRKTRLLLYKCTYILLIKFHLQCSRGAQNPLGGQIPPYKKPGMYIIEKYI